MGSSNYNPNGGARGRGRPVGSWRQTATPGKTAMHPQMRMTWKRALKIERIARLSADPAGYTNEQIANHLGCDKQTIVYIRQTPEYQAKMAEIASGVISEYDRDLRENSDNARSELKSMVPSAMMTIREALLNKRNPNLQFKAALEILDREGTMAKVSKTSVAVTVAPAMQIDPNVTSSIMQLLQQAPITIEGQSATSAADFAAVFSQSASDAEKQQITLANEVEEQAIELLDTKDSKPN